MQLTNVGDDLHLYRWLPKRRFILKHAEGKPGDGIHRLTTEAHLSVPAMWVVRALASVIRDAVRGRLFAA